ncbi:MAG: hypothetical protein AB7G11_03450 [Phycisphaerales bacterium]
MSQFGMQLPGGQVQRGSSMNIYTGLLFLAVVALGAACAFVYMNAGLVGKGGDPFGKQAVNSVSLKNAGGK